YDKRIILISYDGTGGTGRTSAAIRQLSGHATTQKTCAGPRRAPRHRGCSVEIGSRAGGSRAQCRGGAGTRAAEHPRVLPALRIEGPPGCGGLSRDDARRGGAAENKDVG